MVLKKKGANVLIGDVIIQNGANSVVGTAIIQLAKLKGYAYSSPIPLTLFFHVHPFLRHLNAVH